MFLGRKWWNIINLNQQSYKLQRCISLLLWHHHFERKDPFLLVLKSSSFSSSDLKQYYYHKCLNKPEPDDLLLHEGEITSTSCSTTSFPIELSSTLLAYKAKCDWKAVHIRKQIDRTMKLCKNDKQLWTPPPMFFSNFTLNVSFATKIVNFSRKTSKCNRVCSLLIERSLESAFLLWTYSSQ